MAAWRALARTGPAWRALAWTGLAAVAFACYLRVSMTQPVNSDGASNALQAWDMLHGNLLLHGWSLSDVSFYTTELPQYGAVELLLGLHPVVVHAAAAMTYTLVVLLTALLAKGRHGGAGRAVVAAGILLAPQPGAGVYILLLSPDHVGSTVPVLAAFLVLDRARPAGRPAALAAAGVLLSIGLVADPVVAYTGVLPLLTACAVHSYQGGIVAGRRWAAQRYPLAAGAAAAAAAAAAVAISRGLRALGGYQVAPSHPYFATATALSVHLPLVAAGTAALFGADFFGQPAGLAAALAVVHLAGLATAGYAVWLGLRRCTRLPGLAGPGPDGTGPDGTGLDGTGLDGTGLPGPDLITTALVSAVLINLAGFALSTRVSDVRSAREMVAVLPFGAVLAGRLAGERLAAPGRRAATAAVLAAYLAALGYAVVQPAQPAEAQRLAGWLAARRLTTGLAPYWQADVVTLDSQGAVQVSPVCVSGRQVTAEHWESQAGWYRPRRHRATFLITGGSASCDHVTPAQARSAFGRPAHTYRVDGYRVMVWPRNLLTAVR